MLTAQCHTALSDNYRALSRRVVKKFCLTVLEIDSYSLLSPRSEQCYTCPECAKLQKSKFKEEVAAPSTEIFHADASVSPVPHEEKSSNCNVCRKPCLASYSERQGENDYCRTCLDEDFICGGAGCGRKYKRRDGHFERIHLNELKDSKKKRKTVFCKKCRDSKKALQTQ